MSGERGVSLRGLSSAWAHLSHRPSPLSCASSGESASLDSSSLISHLAQNTYTNMENSQSPPQRWVSKPFLERAKIVKVNILSFARPGIQSLTHNLLLFYSPFKMFNSFLAHGLVRNMELWAGFGPWTRCRPYELLKTLPSRTDV